LVKEVESKIPNANQVIKAKNSANSFIRLLCSEIFLSSPFLPKENQ
jgi:hypothetical protein